MDSRRFILSPFFIVLLSFVVSSSVQANVDANKAFDFWNTEGWTLLSNHDGVIGPGSGGQDFDAEYLFYKYDADLNNLSVGLQTGFDVVDGKVKYDGVNYFAGDLALSFDGDVDLGDSSTRSNTYEYAVDFGLKTKNISGKNVDSWISGGRKGIDPEGLYQVEKWDNDILNSTSSPFAMTRGALETNLSMNDFGSGLVDRLDGSSSQNTSFYRKVTFNLDNIVSVGDLFTVDAHWTMSCGNDFINGNVDLARNSAVPEPSIIALFSVGALSLGMIGRLRRRRFTT